MVLYGYLPAHFEGDEKPKGGPLEIKIFLLMAVIEGGWKGVRSLQKPSSTF